MVTQAVPEPPAFGDERQAGIAAYVQSRGRARISELAKIAGVTEVTVRKDGIRIAADYISLDGITVEDAGSGDDAGIYITRGQNIVRLPRWRCGSVQNDQLRTLLRISHSTPMGI